MSAGIAVDRFGRQTYVSPAIGHDFTPGGQVMSVYRDVDPATICSVCKLGEPAHEERPRRGEPVTPRESRAASEREALLDERAELTAQVDSLVRERAQLLIERYALAEMVRQLHGLAVSAGASTGNDVHIPGHLVAKLHRLATQTRGVR